MHDGNIFIDDEMVFRCGQVEVEAIDLNVDTFGRRHFK